MRLLHTSDWHLGRSLHRADLRDAQAAFLDHLVATVRAEAAAIGVDVDVRQTDDEATLIGWLHEAAERATGVVLNPAAFTHYSYAVRDAAAMVGVPLVEVHLTNIAAREEFRRHSYLSDVATGVIVGLGVDGYRLALEHLARR